MLMLLVLLVILFWIGGTAFSIGGGLIHFLLVLALILLLIQFATGHSG